MTPSNDPYSCKYRPKETNPCTHFNGSTKGNQPLIEKSGWDKRYSGRKPENQEPKWLKPHKFTRHKGAKVLPGFKKILVHRSHLQPYPVVTPHIKTRTCK
jgi:hypothetical protein